MSTPSTTKSSLTRAQTATNRRTNRLLRALAVLAAIFIAALLGLGLWPVPPDSSGDEAIAKVTDGSGGLRQLFPAMIAPADNLPTHEKNAERVALGRLLFFDPIMSGGNDTSCATCHHPDLGFSDGRSFSMGTGGHGIGMQRSNGEVLRRSAPSLWNVGYYHRQFWDGRARDLEEQAVSPIINEQEMNENPDRLLSELKQIPEYVEMFDRAFDGTKGSSVSLENIARSLAAFQRTLTANNTPFDRFVRGERDALTDAQRRGFNTFRSGTTRCIECHGLPTFSDRDFKTIGLLDAGDQPDLGRYELTNRQSDRFAFKIPTLRNITMTAPYMHNGSLKTLEEVIDFYSSGGDPRIGTPVEDTLRAFLLTEQEKKDLKAFFFALTDESNMPEVPQRVPSNLPVVPRFENSNRTLVADNNAPASEVPSSRPPQVQRVEANQSIQEAINKAVPGDTIEVMPGVYHERLVVDIDNLTIKAVNPAPAPNDTASSDDLSPSVKRPVLDGERELSDGLIVSGRNFRFEGFEIKNYVANAVFSQYAHNLALKNLRVEKTGLFGIYIFNSDQTSVEGVVGSEIADAGIYVNSSRNIKISKCELYGNSAGIHLTNSFAASVEANFLHDNACGLLVSALPGNKSVATTGYRVSDNHILNNNGKNSAEFGTLIADIPQGVGILVLAADNAEITANEIRGNHSYAIGVLGPLSFTGSGIKFGIGSVPENNWIHDNEYSDNGNDPAPTALKSKLCCSDLVWDLSGWSNRWHEREASHRAPILEGRWPAIARRAYWRLLTLF